jgi:hypothetical protein
MNMTLSKDGGDREYDKFAADTSGNTAVRVHIADVIGDIDLVNNPATVWVITRSDGQPDSETITLSNGLVYTRTFTYASGILTARSAWSLVP